MNTVTEKDELLRRYLLDEMPDDERRETEEKFFEDDDFFDEIAAFEDELLYEYQQNRLTPKQRLVFEEKFLKTAQDREKAAFAAAFLEATEKSEKEKRSDLWESVTAFFTLSNSRFRVGMALTLVLLVCGLGIWLFNDSKWQNVVVEGPKNDNADFPTSAPPRDDDRLGQEKQREESELEKRLEQEKRQAAPSQAEIRGIEEKRDKLQREIEEQRRKNTAPGLRNSTPRKTFVALLLSPGLINRAGAAETAKIKIAPEIETLKLSLKSDAAPQNYRVSILAIDDGREVWAGFAKKTGKRSISLSLPAKLFQRADYEVSLIDPANNEEIESYYFTVLK